MVPSSNIIMMIVVGLGCIVIPIAAYLIVRTKSKNITGAFFAGVLSFFIMQGVIRMNVLRILATNEGYLNFAKENFYVYVLIIAFSAALFETVGRYFSMKWILKDKTSYYAGVAHGIGHGGIEMILLVSLTYVTYLITASQINAGTWQQMIETTRASGASEQMIEQLLDLQDALINTPAKDFLVALLERALTLFVHIGLSVMVAEGIVRNKAWLYSGLAILIHTMVDFTAPVLANAGVNNYIIEAVIAVIAVFAIVLFTYVLRSKKRFEHLNKVFPIDESQEMLESDY